MKIPLKWLTPILLRLLSLSQISFANAATAALQNAGSVHLVAGFHVGLAANPQPHDLSLDSTTYVQLTNQEFTLPIMPLHLLGKKSWNVYNQDNIAKVKRDEAIAAAKEAAEEERMQEIDSERRIQILRGERPTPLAIEDIPRASDDPEHQHARSKEEGHMPRDRDRKKRKRPNEDDTDFELRIARDRDNVHATTSTPARHSSSAPLTDSAGHISLFAPPPPVSSSSATTTKQQQPAAKNPDAELEAARERRAYEDQYTMRFANAAGFKQGLEGPWYSKPAAAAATGGSLPIDDNNDTAAVGGAGIRQSGSNSVKKNDYNNNNKKDIWGAEDPARKRRAAAKMAGEDPLAAMKQGAAEVRRVERERKKWQAERDREMLELLVAQQRERELEREQERKERRREKKRRRVSGGGDDDDDVRRRGGVVEGAVAEEGERDELDELDGFMLDGHESKEPSLRHRRHVEDRKRERRESHRQSSHRREKDRSREREGERNRHRRHSHRH